MDNGLSFPGEEVFLRGLYELAGGDVKHKVAREFGRDHTSQSRVFDAFIDHVYDKFHHLVRETRFILFKLHVSYICLTSFIILYTIRFIIT